MRVGKAWFARDVALCRDYLAGLGLELIADSWVRAIVVSDPKLRERVERDGLTIAPPDEVKRRVHDDPRLVWLGTGTTLGCSLDVAGLQQGRLVAIVGASVYNDGYAGISLRAVVGDSWGAALVRFRGGRQRSLSPTLPKVAGRPHGDDAV